jgi:predicted DNA-binding transcriptional regulator AlpA
VVECQLSPAPASSSASDLLTAKELEEMLWIDVKTIYSYAQRGLIPYVKIQSNLRFVRADIMTWMARDGARITPTSIPRRTSLNVPLWTLSCTRETKAST